MTGDNARSTPARAWGTAAVGLAAAGALLLSGCSADRLSERTRYAERARTSAAVAPAAVAVVPASPPQVRPPAARPAPRAARQVPRPVATPRPAVLEPAPRAAAPPAHPRSRAAPRRDRAPRVAGPHTSGATPDALARGAVLSFYRELDQHDPSACDFLTPAYARAGFGGTLDTALAQCRTSVQAITVRVHAALRGSGAEPAGRTVDVVATIDGRSRRQTLHLILRWGEWLIDSAEAHAG